MIVRGGPDRVTQGTPQLTRLPPTRPPLMLQGAQSDAGFVVVPGKLPDELLVVDELFLLPGTVLPGLIGAEG